MNKIKLNIMKLAVCEEYEFLYWINEPTDFNPYHYPYDKPLKVVAVDELIEYCKSNLTEKPINNLQGDWNEAFKMMIKELQGERR